MTFNIFQFGQKLAASSLMENFRHFCGRGSAILPQNQNGVLLTDKSIDIGSQTNQFGNVYCNKIIQSAADAPSGFIGHIKFDPSPALRTCSSVTYSGTLITATSAGHPFRVGDSISISGQTGNNTVLNGSWEISSVLSTSQFQFYIQNTPPGSLANFNCYPILVHRRTGPFTVVYKTDIGKYQVWYYKTGYSINPLQTNIYHSSLGPTSLPNGYQSYRAITTYLQFDAPPNSNYLSIWHGIPDVNSNNFNAYDSKGIDVCLC